MTKLLSNSELQTYKRCRRKWFLAYWRNLQPMTDRPSGALRLGSQVHAALAAYYTDQTDPVEFFDELYAADREHFSGLEYPPDLSEFEKDHALGRIMLEGYVAWLAESGADADYEIVGAEQQIAVPLLDGEVTYKGKLDIRVRRKSSGRRSFLDSKTCASIDGAVRNLANDEQMIGYLLLERLLDPDDAWIESGLYNLLRKVKRTAAANPPFYDRAEAYHSDVELRNYWLRLHGMIIEIMRARDRLAHGEDQMVVCYPTPRSECTWDCNFYAACPLMDDGSNFEGLIENAFVVGDPYERYIDAAVGVLQ